MPFFLYVTFAFISSGINLSFQHVVFFLLHGWATLYVALFVGTLAGLVTKYMLDKKWIFHYQAGNKKEDLHKFGLYSLMGVFTTIIFMGTEMAFYHMFSFKGSQYIGGALGLTVGYALKYQLDKKFVFSTRG